MPPTLEVPCDLPARLADSSPVEPVRSLVTPGGMMAVVPGEEAAASHQVVQKSSSPPPRPMPKSDAPVPIALDAGATAAFVKEQAPILRTDSAAELATAADEASPRKRTIMGRYVFGTELKPGDHWKRRLSRWV